MVFWRTYKRTCFLAYIWEGSLTSPHLSTLSNVLLIILTPLGFWKGLGFSQPRVPLRILESVNSNQASHPYPSDTAPNVSPSVHLVLVFCISFHPSMAVLHPAFSTAPCAHKWIVIRLLCILPLFTEQFLLCTSCFCIDAWLSVESIINLYSFQGSWGGCSSFIVTISGRESEDGMRKKRSEVRGELAFQIILLFPYVRAPVIALYHSVPFLVTLIF